MVVEGVTLSDLKRGLGHYPGTYMAGQAGNFAVAAWAAGRKWRKWRKWLAYLLALPVGGGTLGMCFEQVGRLLPANI